MLGRILVGKMKMSTTLQIQPCSQNHYCSLFNERNYFFNSYAFKRHEYSSIKRNSLLFVKCLRNNWVSGIRSSAFVKVKIYSESENSFAHKVLENSPLYSETVVGLNYGSKQISEEEFQNIIKKDWSNELCEHVYQAFECLSSYCPKNSYVITDSVFDNICHVLSAKCKNMTDFQLIGTLACLTKWPQTETLNSRNFSSLWTALDKECVNRVKKWDLNKLLYVADHWYQLYLSRVCDYMWHCNWKLGRKPGRLTPSQLVQTMFFLNVYRRIHPGISMYEFEYSFEKCFDKLTIDELGILSMGFFKSQTKIHSTNLLSLMIEKTMREVDNVSDITLSAILKVVRYSIPISLADMLYQLLDKLLLRIDDFSLLSCMHIALAGTNNLILHEEVLKKISQRYSREIKNVRIKDIERLTFALTLFNYDPKTEPCIYKEIVAELHNPERKDEFKKYPKCVSRCIYFLTLRNIFMQELISQTLDSTDIQQIYGENKYKIDREILCLDVSIEIECPEYDGKRIDPNLRSFLAKKYTMWVPSATKRSLSVTDRMMLEVIQACGDLLGGEDYIHAGNILPHFERPDIVFCLSPNGKAIVIPDTLKDTPVWSIKRPPAEDGCWYSVVVGGWNMYIRNTRQWLGSTASKIRHLQMVGYSTIFIPWYEWSEVSASEKRNYLKRKISKQ